MLKASTRNPVQTTDFCFTRMVFDVSSGQVVAQKDLPVEDDMDFMGGIGRSFKIVADYDVDDPFAPEAPLVLNTGCLTGTAFMTGLRAYFTAYSPLKRTLTGKPMAGWSAMSGSFGRKLASTGVGDLVLVGAAEEPKILVIKQGSDGPEVSLLPAPEGMAGAKIPEKMKILNALYNEPDERSFPAHFAVIGPAGEHWETVWMASIAGSTQEMVMSGEEKYRFAGRLGMGALLGAKNILGIVAHAAEDARREGDERLKAINLEIGRGEQSRGFRNPHNHDGLGGTGKNAHMLDVAGVLPFKNFEPRGENLAVPVHLETMRDENTAFVVIDKGCFGCEIACHQDFYAVPEGGRDPDWRVARQNHGAYLGRYEYEPMELSGPNLGVLDPHDNLMLARVDDELGFDTISVNVMLGFVMDHNSQGGEAIGGGIQFGDVAGAARLKEDIAYGREPLLGKGVKAVSEALGGKGFAMHSKGVEHPAYLAQTNPGYPFALAGGHMSMRTFLLYVTDPDCQPESADYWVDQITKNGWAAIAKDLHGGCLFAFTTPPQVAEGISSVYGVDFTAERLLDATYRAHLLGIALELKQGTTRDDYEMPGEVFTGERKGDLPGASFLSRELFEEIRDRSLDYYKSELTRLGYDRYIA